MFPATPARPGHAVPDALLARLRPTVTAPPASVDPRVTHVTVASAALGLRKSLYVHLPPGYDAGADRYPALYLFRGHEREWVNPREDRSRRGTVIDVYLRLLAAGTVGPMILVFPGLTSDDGRLHSAGTDLRARPLAPDAPATGTGRFETYLLDEIVPLVDRLFRTLPDGRHRGADGFSLGGFVSVKLAAKHPGLFATAGAYDGTFLFATADGTRVMEDRVFHARIFDPVFGLPRDQAYAAANNPADLLLRAPSAQVRAVRWLLRHGPREQEPWNANYYRGVYLRELLESLGVTHDLPGVDPEGAHTWATADRHAATTLPLHWDTLRPA